VSPSAVVKRDSSPNRTPSPDADRSAPGTRIAVSPSSAPLLAASTFVNRERAVSTPSATLATDAPSAAACPDTPVIRSLAADPKPVMSIVEFCREDHRSEDLQRSAMEAAISTVR